MAKKIDYSHNLIRDLVLVSLSVVVTIFLLKWGVLDTLFNVSQEFAILGSFIAGLFFTSVFTIAPASIAIAHLSHSVPILTLAVWGAIGSTLGDFIIFSFIKDVFSEDIRGAVKHSRFKRFLSKTHFGFLRWFGPLIGALVIISPLPDELGLSLMGISKMKTRYLIPMALILNFIGIYLLAAVSLNLSV